MQDYDYRYFCKVLQNNGYSPRRIKGSHQTWRNDEKKDSITITCNSRYVNACVGRSLIREHNLKTH